MNKIEVIWIGLKRNYKLGILLVKWFRGEFFFLGVWFNSENENNVVDKNLKIKLEDLKVIFNFWKMCNLLFLGKILIVKILVLLKFVFLVFVILILENIINVV